MKYKCKKKSKKETKKEIKNFDKKLNRKRKIKKLKDLKKLDQERSILESGKLDNLKVYSINKNSFDFENLK